MSTLLFSEVFKVWKKFFAEKKMISTELGLYLHFSVLAMSSVTIL